MVPPKRRYLRRYRLNFYPRPKIKDFATGTPQDNPTESAFGGDPERNPTENAFGGGPGHLPHKISCGNYCGDPEIYPTENAFGGDPGEYPTKRAFQIRFTRAVNAKPPHSRASAAEICEIFDIFHTHSFDTGVAFAVIFGKSD